MEAGRHFLVAREKEVVNKWKLNKELLRKNFTRIFKGVCFIFFFFMKQCRKFCLFSHDEKMAQTIKQDVKHRKNARQLEKTTYTLLAASCVYNAYESMSHTEKKPTNQTQTTLASGSWLFQLFTVSYPHDELVQPRPPFVF